jgi:hypothetical protein
MTLPRHLSGLALAALTLVGGIMSASSAKAEDLVDFLWGGSDEYGGGRSTVSFDPQYKPGQIIVSFSDRRLYFIDKPAHAITYPVAVPTGEARWQGVTFVSDKKVNPPWTPTPDMVRANPRLPRWVPGGHPMNPLGIRAMYLGSSAYRIHGTDAPWTIGQAVSHGCIRMTNTDVLDLYPRVPVGMRVTVTWQRFSTRAVASNDDYSYASGGSSSSQASNSSSYSYGSYGGASGKATLARTATSKKSPSNTGAFAFWNDDADQGGQSAAKASDDDATVDQPEEKPAAEMQPATDKKSASDKKSTGEKKSTAEKSSAEKSPVEKSTSEKSTTEKPAAEKSSGEKSSAEAPKKKLATASSTGSTASEHTKKKSASVADVTRDPIAPPTSMPPDPVKPSASKASATVKTSAPEKDTNLMPAATKASASAADGLPVQKTTATAQVQ